MSLQESIRNSTISEMSEKEVNIRVLQCLRDEAARNSQTILDWFGDQLILAYAIDEGQVYQKSGESYSKLNITDIRPFSEQLGEIKTGGNYDAVTVSAEAYKTLKNKTDDFKTWSLRVVNLGLMAPNMDLYFFDEGEYCKIEWDSEPPKS